MDSGNDMNYAIFKNELRNLYGYEKELAKINDKIADLSYVMTGVKGINYSKIPASANPEISEEKRLELIDELEELENERKRLNLTVKHIYRTLGRLNESDREIVIQIVAKKYNAEMVANQVGYSKSGIWARIKREIEKL